MKKKEREKKKGGERTCRIVKRGMGGSNMTG